MFNEKAESVLLNRTIVDVRYMTDDEAREFGFTYRGVVFQLDDGTIVYPAKDDEGSNAATLHYKKEGDDNIVLPIIRVLI